jgi:hypothetical protein
VQDEIAFLLDQTPDVVEVDPLQRIEQIVKFGLRRPGGVEVLVHPHSMPEWSPEPSWIGPDSRATRSVVSTHRKAHKSSILPNTALEHIVSIVRSKITKSTTFIAGTGRVIAARLESLASHRKPTP